MAVALDFDYAQSNDNKIIKITDSTGEYDVNTNNGGWGSPNQPTSDIVGFTTTTASKYHLLLSIVYTDSTSVETTYDNIDLFNNFTSEFLKTYGMEYSLNMSHLKVSSISQGISSDVFPDGIYDITYTIKEADTGTVIYSKNKLFLVYGVIQDLVYDNIYSSYSEIWKQKQFNSDERDWQELLDGIFIYSYYNGMLTDNTAASKSEKIDNLYFLQQRLNS